MEPLQALAFVGREGEAFSLVVDGQPRAARIASVARTETTAGETVTVVFEVDDGAPPQGLYAVSHKELGDFELFLVPNSPTQTVAVFTWLHTA